jgi:hypothetical protein
MLQAGNGTGVCRPVQRSGGETLAAMLSASRAYIANAHPRSAPAPAPAPAAARPAAAVARAVSRRPPSVALQYEEPPAPASAPAAAAATAPPTMVQRLNELKAEVTVARYEAYIKPTITLISVVADAAALARSPEFVGACFCSRGPSSAAETQCCFTDRFRDLGCSGCPAWSRQVDPVLDCFC